MASKTDEAKRGDVCSHKLALFLDNWVRRVLQNPQKIVEEYIKEGDTVIDFGCGPGYFSIDMAKMVGASGTVIAADMQSDMLDRVRKKAERHNVQERMEFHRCRASSSGLQQKADFILAFYVVHETPDAREFFKEIKQLLNSGGRLLVVEPKIHVSRRAFEETLSDAQSVGWKIADFPKGKGGRGVLLFSE